MARFSSKFVPYHEVEVRECNANHKLERTYEALDWLRDRGFNSDKHYDINMWGGTTGFTTFYFNDPRLAVEFKLHFGGAAPG